jgi:hypothetical protein
MARQFHTIYGSSRNRFTAAVILDEENTDAFHVEASERVCERRLRPSKKCAKMSAAVACVQRKHADPRTKPRNTVCSLKEGGQIRFHPKGFLTVLTPSSARWNITEGTLSGSDRRRDP